ncbi:helix-turn-helix transcriptional regulator [Lonepinella sp. BR2357]|uniref:helix-turn-helix transcriptional regulator n=1 Tax=Lonepinella sp. BR2357 TaxID=3434549 RepID=UPI003F6DB916
MLEKQITVNSKELWGIKQIANYLGLSYRYVQSLKRDPNFPKPIRLPKLNDPSVTSTRPKFFAGDIVRYCEQCRTPKNQS